MMRLKKFYLTFLLIAGMTVPGFSQISGIVINEFLASNGSVNTDVDGDYSDWIELYNTGSTAVDLTNYYLTDDPANPLQWQFPAIVLNSQEYLLVWASGKNRTTGGELHTNFKLSAKGEFVGLYQSSGTAVDTTSFGAQSVDVSMARIPNGSGEFQLTNIPTPESYNRASDADLNTLTLTAPNGGETWFAGSLQFIRWQWTGLIPEVRLEYSSDNGSSWIVIADSVNNDGDKRWLVPNTVSNTCLVRIMATGDHSISDVSDASFAIVDVSPYNGNLLLNEFLALNVSVNADDDGDFSDWIELYNSDTVTIDLTGYFLSDDANNPYKWQLPGLFLFPKDYLLIWASGKDRVNGDTLHTNFKLNDTGEFLGLYDPIGAVLDSLTFGEQLPDVAMARIPDGSSPWQLTNIPTPDAMNRSSDSQLNSITITSPNGGESYLANTLQEIKWTWSGVVGWLRLSFSGDGGFSWIVIKDSTQNDGSTSWVVPDVETTSCLVRLTAVDDPSVSDTNDEYFNVFGQSPHYADVVINEFMADNKSFNKDEDGDFEDWVEVYNTGSSAVDLAQYYLSDDAKNPYKWQFPSVVLQPQGYLLIWASGKNRNSETAIHSNFRLNNAGEFLGLYDPLGKVLDSLSFGAQQTDFSTARLPDGDGSFHVTNVPTPEAQNKESTVPVELASFTAKIVANKSVLLEWRVDSEKNNFGFEIERKDQSEDYQKITFIKGRNTSSVSRVYSFRDRIEKDGLYYYRLKQIDLDGSIKYSPEISINVTLPKLFSVAPNYPNPFNSSTVFSFSVPRKSFTEIKIYSLQGALVKTLYYGELAAGRHQMVWNGQDNSNQPLPSGTYFIKFSVGDKIKLRKALYVK